MPDVLLPVLSTPLNFPETHVFPSSQEEPVGCTYAHCSLLPPAQLLTARVEHESPRMLPHLSNGDVENVVCYKIPTANKCVARTRRTKAPLVKVAAVKGRTRRVALLES